MNPDAKEVFTAYFGTPIHLYEALAALLFVVMGLAWIVITIKAFKERSQDKNKDDSDVLSVVIRGLLMMLIMVAIFSFT